MKGGGKTSGTAAISELVPGNPSQLVPAQNQSNPRYTVAAVKIEKPASKRGESPPEGERSPAPPAGFEERLSQMAEAVKTGMRSDKFSRQCDPQTEAPELKAWSDDWHASSVQSRLDAMTLTKITAQQE